MALPVWPAIPYASRYEGFSVAQEAVPVLATDMNAGTTRQRNTFTLRVGTQNLSIEMAADEVALFDAFHASLGNGAARFTMPIWNGAAYLPKTVAIVKGQVSKSQVGVDTQAVTFQVRVENP